MDYRVKTKFFFSGKKRITISLIFLFFFFCSRLTDILGPYSPSKVTLKGRTYDKITLKPLKGALIRIESTSTEVFTDDSGFFEIKNITTGIHKLLVSCSNYNKMEFDFDVTLSPGELTIFLDRKDEPPLLKSFFIEKDSLRFCDDSIKLIFTVSDSSGGLKKIDIYLDYSSLPIKTYEFNENVYFFSDTFKFVTTSSNNKNIKLVVTDQRGYLTKDSIYFSLPVKRRPVISLIRFPQDGFISEEWGYVEIFIEDLDSVFDFLTIDWKDGGDSVISYEREGVYWRKISVKESMEWKIHIKIFSEDIMIDDSIVAFQIRVILPPLLDDKIFLNPRYCAPHDTAIIIGVNVLSVEKGCYIKEILWIINEGETEPVFTFLRENFDEKNGVVSPTGTLFIRRFLIEKFKGINTVKIIVTDSNGNSSIVSGIFYIAGRAE